MLSAGIEPTMRAVEWQQIYSLDRTATGINKCTIILVKLEEMNEVINPLASELFFTF